MPPYIDPSFELVIDIALRQKESDIARCVRETHEHLLAAAMAETSADALAAGVYRLRYYLAEGGCLHQWLAILTARSTVPSRLWPPFSAKCHWGGCSSLNDQPELAASSASTRLNT